MRLVPVATTLHDALSERTAIRSAHVIRHGRIAESSKPVIYPLHGVSRHVANIHIGRGKVTNFMQLKARIIRSPSRIRSPIQIRHISPFRFRRQTVAFFFRVECKALQIGAVLFGIENCSRIGVSRIKAFGLATGIGKQDRIVVSQIRGRQIFTFTIQRSARRLHHVIKFTASHLMLANRKIVIQQDLHLRAFIRLRCRFVCTEMQLFLFQSNRKHSV